MVLGATGIAAPGLCEHTTAGAGRPDRSIRDNTPRKARASKSETGTLKLFRTLKANLRITGGAVSPDERWVALRSNRTLLVYTLDGFVNGNEPIRIDLRRFNEPQGEGVTFGSDADLYLVSEGGGKNAAGMLTRIDCEFLR